MAHSLYDQTAESLRKLLWLLDNREPGLFSWQDAVMEARKDCLYWLENDGPRTQAGSK